MEDYIMEDSDGNFEEKILTCVANSSAIFKSQQKNEPNLEVEEKKEIARKCLRKNNAQFLLRFGKYLDANLLKYFAASEDIEVNYLVKKLTRYFDKTTRQIDVKNRRYEALKLMIEKGEYFSETEMMKRNPLLYDNLVGKYLTEEQKVARDNPDNHNQTFVHVLMKGIERDILEKFKKEQEDAEDNALEENDSDSESDTEVREKSQNSRWGEMSQVVNTYATKEKEKKVKITPTNISIEEICMFRQEFVTQMYQNFLNGQDESFDYSCIDENEAYDNIDLQTQDEEDKYFSSESPEWVPDEKNSNQPDDKPEESEDELDKYMKSLKEPIFPSDYTESPT